MHVYIYICVYVCICLTSVHTCIHIYIYTYIWRFPVFSDKGIDHGLTPTVHALPSEAKHARSEAKRVVTANCT